MKDVLVELSFKVHRSFETEGAMDADDADEACAPGARYRRRRPARC